MCGKSNPAEAETCQYCRAQLKPLGISGDMHSTEPVSADWLTEVRASSTPSLDESQPEETPKTNGEEEIPGWLVRIRQREQEEQEVYRDIEGIPSDSEGKELPDWADGILGSSEETTEEGSEENWLARLRKNKGIPETEPPGSEPVQTTGEEPLEPLQSAEDDWMTQLKNFQSADTETLEEDFSTSPDLKRETEDEAAEELSAGATEEDEFSGWLRSLEEQASKASPPASPPQETSSAFLDDIDLTDQKLKAFESETGGPPEGELPSWLTGVSVDENSGSVPAAPIHDDTPDWLKAFAEPDAVSVPPPAANDETPEWLKGFETETLSPDATAPLTDQPDRLEKTEETSAVETEASETPDWLKAFAELETDSAPPPAANDETPEWLKGFGAETPSPAVTTPLTDKLDELETTGETPAAGEPAAGAEASEPPDWLKTFENLTGEGTPQSAAHAETMLPSTEAGGEDQDDGGGLQDWFSQLPAEEPGGQKEEILPESVSSDLKPESAGDVVQPESQSQDFLLEELISAETSSSVFQIGGENVELPEEATPFVNQETSEWSLQESAVLSGAEENGAEGLAPATLPGWLEAMRPVEAIVGEQAQAIDEDQIEISGPLAGLPGVLPTEDVVGQYRKPPVYSAKLQVTERQRTQAGILEELIRNAGKPQAFQKENPETPRLLIRIGLALILIFAILYPILFGPPTTETPGLGMTAETLTFSNQIEALRSGQTVLLVVDYDAGYSGEMRFAAKGVIQRLIQKRLNLALLSTVPAGPVLAEDLLRQASSELQAAGALSAPLPAERVINLGYLPGGLSSLQELALNPQQAARYAFNASKETKTAWEHPALQGITELSGFAAVIVLTDSLETGRAWIEQTGGRLGGTPLLLVTSAQAAPMLKPYASSGQVDGMLSGLMDGMAYERLAKTPGNAAAYWNAYRYGMYVMVAFMISGVILRAIVWLLSRRNKAFK